MKADSEKYKPTHTIRVVTALWAALKCVRK